MGRKKIVARLVFACLKSFRSYKMSSLGGIIYRRLWWATLFIEYFIHSNHKWTPSRLNLWFAPSTLNKWIFEVISVGSFHRWMFVERYSFVRTNYFVIAPKRWTSFDVLKSPNTLWLKWKSIGPFHFSWHLFFTLALPISFQIFTIFKPCWGPLRIKRNKFYFFYFSLAKYFSTWIDSLATLASTSFFEFVLFAGNCRRIL